MTWLLLMICAASVLLGAWCLDQTARERRARRLAEMHRDNAVDNGLRLLQRLQHAEGRYEAERAIRLSAEQLADARMTRIVELREELQRERMARKFPRTFGSRISTGGAA